MKFGVLALDYDGTIARDGVLDLDVKAAITEARARAIVVVLVTGRILSCRLPRWHEGSIDPGSFLSRTGCWNRGEGCAPGPRVAARVQVLVGLRFM